MEPIPVPAPPKSSFNKGRRISDLLDSQIKHFQHLEKTLKLDVPPLVAADVHTEAGAARYIAQITTAIRKRPLETSSVPPAKQDATTSGAPDASSKYVKPTKKAIGPAKSKTRKNP